jgi:peptidyl-prolyl cis-trans isomerase SurA
MRSPAGPLPLGAPRARASARRLAFLLAGAVMAGASPAMATVVERVVAVVGEEAILMSDLQRRATPYLMRAQQELPTESHRAAAVTQLHKSLVEQLIDEQLIERAARRAKMAITDSDVDQALTRVAKQNGVTVERLLSEIVASGFTESQYREELRRQLLDARVLGLRVTARVQVREEDLRTTYRSMLLEERARLPFEASWIVLSDAARETGKQLVEQLRTGGDFPALAARHSLDETTKGRGGQLGRVDPSRVPKPLIDAASRLEIGEVSEPIKLGNRLILLKVTARDASELPAYDEARAELSERVYSEKVGKARRRWLDGLRRQTHVEVRL